MGQKQSQREGRATNGSLNFSLNCDRNTLFKSFDIRSILRELSESSQCFQDT